jgi:phosphoglycolate phosphatase
VPVIRNIIFDWSGTLVDDLPAVWRATNYVFRQAGRAEITLETFRAEFCLPFKHFYDRLLPNVQMDQLETWFHEHFRQVQDLVVPLPHAREFLEATRAHGLRTFVLTSVHEEHWHKQARAAGFEHYFEHAYVGVWDKQARIGAIVQERGLNPAETLFVGDMQHDIDTAKHAGLHSCAVLTGYNTLGQLRQSNPDRVVEHLGELKAHLLRNNWELLPEHTTTDLLPVSTVGAAIFDPERRVLMVRTHKWSNLWGIPGGKIKYGEPALDALLRELKEETNLHVRDIQFVLVQDCINSTEFYRPAHFVLLNYSCIAANPAEVRLNEEAQEFRWLCINDALALPLNKPTRILLEELLRREKR